MQETDKEKVKNSLRESILKEIRGPKCEETNNASDILPDNEIRRFRSLIKKNIITLQNEARTVDWLSEQYYPFKDISEYLSEYVKNEEFNNYSVNTYIEIALTIDFWLSKAPKEKSAKKRKVRIVKGMKGVDSFGSSYSEQLICKILSEIIGETELVFIKQIYYICQLCERRDESTSLDSLLVPKGILEKTLREYGPCKMKPNDAVYKDLILVVYGEAIFGEIAQFVCDPVMLSMKLLYENRCETFTYKTLARCFDIVNSLLNAQIPDLVSWNMHINKGKADAVTTQVMYVAFYTSWLINGSNDKKTNWIHKMITEDTQLVFFKLWEDIRKYKYYKEHCSENINTPLYSVADSLSSFIQYLKECHEIEHGMELDSEISDGTGEQEIVRIATSREEQVQNILDNESKNPSEVINKNIIPANRLPEPNGFDEKKTCILSGLVQSKLKFITVESKEDLCYFLGKGPNQSREYTINWNGNRASLRYFIRTLYLDPEKKKISEGIWDTVSYIFRPKSRNKYIKVEATSYSNLSDKDMLKEISEEIRKDISSCIDFAKTATVK